MDIRTVIDRLDLIESMVELEESAEEVLGSIAAAINYGKTLQGVRAAGGIDDPDRQLMKIAGILAGIQNAVRRGGDPAVGKMLASMEPAPQDTATAAVIDKFAPTGDDNRSNWFKLIQRYEAAVKTGDKSAMAELGKQVNTLLAAARKAAPQPTQQMRPKYA